MFDSDRRRTVWPAGRLVKALGLARQGVSGSCQPRLPTSSKRRLTTAFATRRSARRSRNGTLWLTKSREAELKADYLDGMEETADGKTLAGGSTGILQKLEKQTIRDLLRRWRETRQPQAGRPASCRRQKSASSRVHGSAVAFTHGETQSIATITLGTARDTQRVDGPVENTKSDSYFRLRHVFGVRSAVGRADGRRNRPRAECWRRAPVQ